jgi:hypothetical protein
MNIREIIIGKVNIVRLSSIPGLSNADINAVPP